MTPPLPSPLSLAQRAYLFALRRHEGQRYGNAPYSYHLAMTVAVLQQHGFDEEETLAAGWLHDVIEDGKATDVEVCDLFGPKVTALVVAVSGVGENRQARNRNIYEKLALLPAAIPIKLADRIANVESCWATRDAKLFMYHREHGQFIERLAYLNQEERTLRLWETLNALTGWRKT